MPAGWNGGPVLAIPAWLPVEGVVAVLPVGERKEAVAAPAPTGPAPATIEVLLRKLEGTAAEIGATIPRLSNLLNEPGQKERIAAALATLEQGMNAMRRSLGIPEPVPGPIQIIEKGAVRVIHVPLEAKPARAVEAPAPEAEAPGTEAAANPANPADPADPAPAPAADAPEAAPEKDDELDVPLAHELLASLVPAMLDTAKRTVPGAKKLRDYARSNLWSDFIPDPTPMTSGVLIGQTWRKLEVIRTRIQELPEESRANMQDLHRAYAAAVPGLADALAPSLSALVDVENRLNHFAGYRKAMTATQAQTIDKNLPAIRQMVATHRKLLEMLTPPAAR